MNFDFNAQYTPLGQTENAVNPAPRAGRSIAVIGTAGRDKSKPMTRTLWLAMCADLESRLNLEDHLISGGAAWADHLAVHAYLQGWVQHLTLYLPAPLGAQHFEGPGKSAASAANYYHALFSREVGIDSLAQIRQVLHQPGVQHTEEFPLPGYGAMFSRNKKVASAADSVIAYTFGPDQVPADGGTLNTWQQIQSESKVHVPLDALIAQHQNIHHEASSRAHPRP